MIWAVVKVILPPDDYIAPVLRSAALHVFDLSILTDDLILQLVGTLASYAVAFLILRRVTPTKAHLYATAIVAVALTLDWRWFHHALHTSDRLRTVVLIVTPLLGGLAAVRAALADGRLKLPLPFLPGLVQALSRSMTARVTASAFLLVMLVHAVETLNSSRLGLTTSPQCGLWLWAQHPT